jgi:hypothetical protein
VVAAPSLLLGLLAPDLLDEAKDWMREASWQDPAAAVIWVTLIGAHAFYRAEVGHNPKVKTLDDALVYVSTNLSVGYCDIFAVTDRGKQIVTLLMMFGPALAARALDAPSAETRAEAAAQEAREDARHDALLARLDRLAELLRPAVP